MRRFTSLILILVALACQRGYIVVPESDRSIKDALDYYNQGDFRSALDLIRNYLNRYPSSFERDDALYLGAACAFKLEEFRLASRYTKEIIRRYPHSDHATKAHLIFGLSRIRLGSLEEGTSSLIDVIETSSDDKERQEASNKIDSILPLLSIPSLRKIHRQHIGQPVDEWILFQLAKKEVEEKRYDQAREDLDRYLDLFPTGEHADEARSLLRFAGMGGSTGRVGLLIPLTGQFKEYGSDAQTSFLRVFADTDKVMIGDTRSDPIEALINAQKMIEEKVDLIVGPIFGVEALPIAGLAITAGIPLILPTESDPRFSRLPEGIVSLSNETIRDADAIAQFAIRSLSLKRPAILYPKTKRGEFLASVFKDRFEKMGGKIVAAVPFDPDSLTMKWELLGIKRKRPDGIFLPVDPKLLVMICTQIKYHELIRVKILTVGTAVNDDVIRLGEEYVEGIYFARPVEEGVSSPFAEKDPGFVSEKFGLAARIVKASLAKATDREDLIKRIRSFTKFEEKVFTIKNGMIKPVEG